MSANNFLAIIFANSFDRTINGPTQQRATGSVPFGGRYRMIDFILSSLVHSGISKVGIVTKSNYRSLMDHVGSGKPWDLSRKNQGLYILPPYDRQSSGGNESKLDSLRSALSFLEASTQEYVVLCESNIIGDVDIAKLIGYYEDSGADMVVACKEGPSPLAAANRFSFTLAEDGRVVRACGTGEFNCTDHGIGIIVLKKTLLASLIGGRNYLSGETFREIISANIDSLKIYALRGSSPVLLPDTLESYFSACMKFLEPSFRKELFVPQRPVYTKVMDEMPALYGLDCKVSHSLIADGCKVFGSAENSILFRDVRIEKGAHVKNCVIMQGCTIGEGAKLENVILDKNVSVSANARIAPAGIEYFAKYSNF